MKSRLSPPIVKLPLCLAPLGFLALASLALGQGIPFNGKTGFATPSPVSLLQPAAVQDKAAKIILPEVNFHDATLPEAINFLRIKSRELDPAKSGINLLVSSGGNPDAKLTMNLTDIPLSEAVKYIASLAGLKVRLIPYAIMLEDPSTNDSPAPPPAKPGTPDAVLWERAMKMIVPRIQFHGTTLAEAVDFLRWKSGELNGKPLNIFVKGTPASAAAKLDLDVTDVPVAQALGWCASLAHLGMHVKGGTFYFHPLEENID